MSRTRLSIFALVALITFVLSRGVMQVRTGTLRTGSALPAVPKGQSAQAARTDPALLSHRTESDLPASAIEAIRQEIRDAGATVYLPAMFAETDSVLRRWSDADAPSIRVAYLIGDVPGWTTEDQEIARTAFRSWEQVGLPVRFVEVLDTAGAAMVVRWVPHFSIDRAGQTDLTWDEQGRIHRALIQLALEDSGGHPISREGLRAVALHEVGHALGLPHSDQGSDLMFPTTRHPVLTDRDVATIHLLYGLPPVSIK